MDNIRSFFSWKNMWGVYIAFAPWVICLVICIFKLISMSFVKQKKTTPKDDTLSSPGEEIRTDELRAVISTKEITHTIEPNISRSPQKPKGNMQEQNHRYSISSGIDPEVKIYPPSKLEKAGMRFLLERKLWEVYRNNINFLLSRYQIYTIGDMVAHERQYIASLEKVGEKTMENIESFMFAFGLDWGIDTRRYDKSAPYDTVGQRGYGYDAAGLKFLFSRHVWEIFPYSVTSKLQLAGLEVMADILLLKKGQISRRPGIGDKTSAILEDYVKDNGLAWGCQVHRYVIENNIDEWILFNPNSRKYVKGIEGHYPKGRYLKWNK